MKAEETYQEALKGEKVVQSSDHASTLPSINNLGHPYLNEHKLGSPVLVTRGWDPLRSINIGEHGAIARSEQEKVTETQRPSSSQRQDETTGETATDAAAIRTRSVHNHSTRRKEMKFGDYILGQTIGEGDHGKVKIGWKRDGSVQPAIKLIRKESLDSNPTHLPKIHREIAILKELDHPNIVRLHEMYETERHIGIILEYASGGELFDYILQHRYLKDNAARRLFAQLVSGVGYLHKKGIAHRNLNPQNIMLDRNRNVVIIGFSLANSFNPDDELPEEIEHGLSDKEFVKRFQLDKIQPDGNMRGDLMQTSCGAPYYAAPEVIICNTVYAARKVDVWSCGVILVSNNSANEGSVRN
jgi:protein-serine/threonine kinase